MEKIDSRIFFGICKLNKLIIYLAGSFVLYEVGFTYDRVVSNRNLIMRSAVKSLPKVFFIFLISF